MPRHLHLDPFNGVAGDMLLAALAGLGAPLAEVVEAVRAVPFPGAAGLSLHSQEVVQCGVRGLGLRVTCGDGHGPHGTYDSLRHALARAPAPPRVLERALATLDCLGRAEARAQGVTLPEARFFELGGLDTLTDLLGVPLALEILGVDTFSCAPLPLASGSANIAGIAQPAVAPSTLELLAGLPVVGIAADQELVTPTGAALARTLATSYGPAPALTLLAASTGFGATPAAGRPNCLRLTLGNRANPGDGLREVLVLLEANLDDLSAEILATLPGRCLAAGAVDAWLTPALMKKGRPGHLVSALARDAEAPGVADALFRHSSTLGVRQTRVEREALARTWESVETPWGPVRVKLGRRAGVTVNRAPEYEECRRVAEAAGVPLKEVYAAALASGPGVTGSPGAETPPSGPP